MKQIFEQIFAVIQPVSMVPFHWKASICTPEHIWRNVALSFGVSIVLSGCIFGASTATIMGANLIGTQAFLSFTKKLPTDHVGDSVTGLDCNYLRSLKDGGFLCRPLNSQIVEAPVYCYRTLARVDCYEQPLRSDGARMVN